MELKLIVLAGAKEGLEIPLKKDKFLIGRAKECSLRAGSEAISRRHCAIIRVKDKWAVRDLGSRNGTHVNGKRIEEPTRLRPGDELVVGPLKFRVEERAAKPEAKAEEKPSVSIPALAPAEPNKPRRQPPVKDVADIVERSISNSSDSSSEDDISGWLLGLVETNGKANLKETLSLRMEDTNANGRIPPASDPATTETVDISADSALTEAVDTPDANGEAEEGAAEGSTADGKSAWGLFGRGKGAPKKKPGKLPPRTDQQSKDSREAAADILREMTRRR